MALPKTTFEHLNQRLVAVMVQNGAWEAEKPVLDQFGNSETIIKIDRPTV